MACLPNTPITPNILTDPITDGLQPLGSGLITTALSRYYPLVAALVPMQSVMNTSLQHGVIRQVDFIESAPTSGDVKKTPLLIYCYGQPAPTTPTSGAVYNGSSTGLMGIIKIADTDYRRVSDTVWIASVQPNLHIRTTSGASSQVINLVIVSDSSTSVTYATGASGSVRLFVEQGTAL
jgi:hypothetical protein